MVWYRFGPTPGCLIHGTGHWARYHMYLPADHTIPYHDMPTITYHTIPYHDMPYHEIYIS